MAMIDDIPGALDALEFARAEETERIAEAVRGNRVVGVLGEGEVGKTETIRQALGLSDSDRSVIHLDLRDAAGEEHLAFHLLRKIAESLVGARDLSALKVGTRLPPLEAIRIELAERFGVDGLDEALRDWPSGQYPLERALSALEDLATQRQVALWIDHLESPALTPRHPLDLQRLLWGIREMAQRVPSLSIVLSGHNAIEGRVLGPEAAFHQQGRWLSLDYPSAQAWVTVAMELDLPKSAAADFEDLTEGHPSTMLLCYLSLRESVDSGEGAFDTMQDLASGDAGLVSRAMEHARSLHRLGGQIMIQVAHGEGPYAGAQRGASPPQDIRKALEKLRLAGLLRRTSGWAVLNPLVRIALRGQVVPITAPDWELGFEPDPED